MGLPFFPEAHLNTFSPGLTAFISGRQKHKTQTYGEKNARQNPDKLLIVADDFTGANDTGVQFAKKKLRTIMLTGKEKIRTTLKNCDVLVVDTESRFDGGDTAYIKAREAGKTAEKEKIKYVYKKLDSTMRGNIGAEISGVMDSTGIGHAVVVPAFPANGRITKDGNVYVKGVLLEETEFANDPKTPVKGSYIPEIISRQTDKKTALINYNDLRSGKEHLINKLKELMGEGARIIVIDVLDNDDLEMIASSVTSFRDKILYAGSTGFAEYLPEYLFPGRIKKSNVVIAGSVSSITRWQIEYARKNLDVRVIDIDAEQLFKGGSLKEKERVLEIIKDYSGVGQDFIIRTAPSEESVSKCFDLGRKSGLDRFKVSETTAVFLGELAKDIITDFSINGIMITGGDTAIKVATALNISGTIIKDEISPGIPWGHFLDRHKDIIVVSKAGGFGGEEAIYMVLNFLNQQGNR